MTEIQRQDKELIEHLSKMNEKELLEHISNLPLVESEDDDPTIIDIGNLTLEEWMKQNKYYDIESWFERMQNIK